MISNVMRSPNFQRLVKFLFIALFVAYLWQTIHWQEVGRALVSIGIPTFGFCLVLEWAFFLVESWRIRFLSQGLYSFSTILRSRFVSLILGYVLPGLAVTEVARVFLMDREVPGNKMKIAFLLLTNRLFGFLALAAVFALPLILHWPHYVGIFGPKIFAFILICGLVSLLPGIVQITALRAWIARRMRKTEKKKLYHFSRKIYLSLVQFTDRKRWVWVLLTSVLTNFIVIFEFWLIGNAVGSGIDFPTWCFIVPFIAVATFLPLGIGAVGTQDAALIAAASLLKVPVEPILAVSVAMHLLRYLGPLPGVFFVGDIVLLFRQFRKKA